MKSQLYDKGEKSEVISLFRAVFFMSTDNSFTSSKLEKVLDLNFLIVYS